LVILNDTKALNLMKVGKYRIMKLAKTWEVVYG